MLRTYRSPRYEYRTPPELHERANVRYPVVVVGAGPVGLVAAIDLAQSGTPVVLVDEDDTVSTGSRGICYAKRTLEILDRLGVGDDCIAKGVSWNVGRTFLGRDEVYSFDLQRQSGHKRPGMVNLQQYYLEEYLIRRALALQCLDLRFKSRVVGVAPEADGMVLKIQTPDGEYSLRASWLVAADGARSGIRRKLGLDIDGQVFPDRFLIADVTMKGTLPPERRFWFDPPFHRNKSVLLHRQADDVWRIDFQLDPEADADTEKKPDRVMRRIRAMFGDEREFELEWVSVYTFQSRRMPCFRHGRVVFVGDAAHQVSPFGARGANSGIQDADNLCWKLRLVLEGRAPEALLDTYSEERVLAADENIRHSNRSMDFIAPRPGAALTLRNAVLELARDHEFARPLVNSGRLSVPTILSESRLNTADGGAFAGAMVPGAPLDDAPVSVSGRAGWLLDHVQGRFTVLYYVDDEPADGDVQQAAMVQALAGAVVPLEVVPIARRGHPGAGASSVLEDSEGRFAERYDALHGTTYLVRPDQHACGRWRTFRPESLLAALARATCNAPATGSP